MPMKRNVEAPARGHSETIFAGINAARAGVQASTAEENLRKAVNKTSNDATLHEHLGDLYQKTGRLKLAADHWARALEEWNKSVPTDVDSTDVAKVQKKLEGARVKLAQQQK